MHLSAFHQLVHILGNFIIGHFGIALRGPDVRVPHHLADALYRNTVVQTNQCCEGVSALIVGKVAFQAALFGNHFQAAVEVSGDWHIKQFVVLAFSGFYVRDDGKVAHADKATTLDAARARAGRLKAALESRVVHAEVLNYCRAELLEENYFHAVFEATKGVAERIRLLSGLNGDGADLVNKAFAGQQPVLALGPLTTESEKSEQKGFANLLIGLFGAVRNPLAHAPKTNWPMSEQDALDILTLVSLIHRKLDGTTKLAAVSP